MSDNKSTHKFKAGDIFHERYSLEKLIGVGGFADVWKATDNKTHTTVVLKIYTNLDGDGIYDSSDEISQMKQILNIDNVIKTYQFNTCAHIPYLAIEFCCGDLEKIIGSIIVRSYNNVVKRTDEKSQSILFAKSEKKEVRNNNVLSNFWQNRKSPFLIAAIIVFVLISIAVFFTFNNTTGKSDVQILNEAKSSTTGTNENFITTSQQQSQSDDNQTSATSNIPDKPNEYSRLNQQTNPATPKNVQQSVRSQQLKTEISVSQDYINMLHITYNSIADIRRKIDRAQKYRHFTSADANALKDFVSNVHDLNNQKKGKTLTSEQEKLLAYINTMSKEASQALVSFKIYDE